jgi:hypothetical protein
MEDAAPSPALRERLVALKPWLFIAARIAAVLLLVAGFLECFYLWMELIWRHFLYSHFDSTPMMNHVTEVYHTDFRGHVWTAIVCLCLSGGILFWLKGFIRLGICLVLLIAAVVALQVELSFTKSGVYASGPPPLYPVPSAQEPEESPPTPGPETTPEPAPPPSETVPADGLPPPPAPDPAFLPQPAPPSEPQPPSLESLPGALPGSPADAPSEPSEPPAPPLESP